MNGFYWNYGDNWKEVENNKDRRTEREKGKHTRLVIDEDSIYEIDLDCIECRERGGGTSSF